MVDPTEVTSGHHAIQFVGCQEIPDQDRADVVDNLDGAALAMMECNPDRARAAVLACEESVCAVQADIEVPKKKRRLVRALLALIRESYLGHANDAVHEMDFEMLENPVVHPFLKGVDLADLMDYCYSVKHYFSPQATAD